MTILLKVAHVLEAALQNLEVILLVVQKVVSEVATTVRWINPMVVMVAMTAMMVMETSLGIMVVVLQDFMEDMVDMAMVTDLVDLCTTVVHMEVVGLGPPLDMVVDLLVIVQVKGTVVPVVDMTVVKALEEVAVEVMAPQKVMAVVMVAVVMAEALAVVMVVALVVAVAVAVAAAVMEVVKDMETVISLVGGSTLTASEVCHRSVILPKFRVVELIVKNHICLYPQ